MLSRRESYLLALLPALAVLALEELVLAPRLARRVEAAQARIVEHGAQEVAARASLERANQIDARKREIEGLQRDLGAAEARMPRLLERWSRPERRAHVLNGVARLFAEHGARLSSSTLAPQGDGPDVPALRELARSVQAQGGAEPEVWRFEFGCGFPALVEVLDALPRADGFLLPLGLEVHAGADGGQLAVRLWAWI